VKATILGNGRGDKIIVFKFKKKKGPYRVALANGNDVLTTLGGNMRRFRIRVLAGDRVKIEVSPYDLTRGRITYRHKA